ncbi:MAG: hypothetical protein EP329_27600 [Deltaproteobacteria bacterium]|nr:MAG: hypothetical protein EP329_27600 [Deltaproteobacteria bacterium]
MLSPKRLLVPLLLALVALPACGDDDVVAHSETVTLSLSSLKPADIKQGAVSVEKNINTESGNPYAAFLKNAKDALGGKDPGSIVLISATLRVEDTSTNVTGFETLLTDVDLFLTNSAGAVVVGTVDAPTGMTLTVPLDETVDYAPLAESMLGGDFKVGISGGVVDPEPTDFDLSVSVDLNFKALK